MTKRMLIDATQTEETRVAVISGNKLEEYDYETLVRKQLKSNIYLVKVTRVEPSLQAAFVDFGGNRHGFLPFPEIHPDYYRIPIADREALLAEERAMAAAQAAKEDEEDAAELAASGESLEDLDIEEESGEAEDGDDEDYVPQHTGSIAEVIEQDSLSDDDAAEEEEESEDAGEEDEDGAEEASGEDAAEDAAEDVMESDGEDQPEEIPVETIGGDSVETPVYRSSIKRKYKIQEVIKRNQIMLIQISKEERGNKGAAVTTYISLPGRYCVLMPNSPRGGGVSRKVSNVKDRQRLKKILADLNVPEGMSVILRTAGVSRTKAEIKRDLDYLLRLWDQIRELTLKSTAPALIYEEGNLIKRAIRDLYRRDIDEVHVAGETGFKTAHDFMNTLMPSHAERIREYKDESMPLFMRYQVEKQIDEIHNPTVHLKSGGYIVINPTEAMVSIDVNSGKATKGRHIEETALKTNLEAAEEIARQLRLRDLGGLVVIDFIDMEDKRGNRTVEKRVREAMASDRARIQLGRISAFGLMELSRQRLNPSLVETNFEVCAHCNGTGLTRTVATSAVMVLRAIEEEAMRARPSEVKVGVAADIAIYILNHKREILGAMEKRHNMRVFIHADDSLIKPNYTIEMVRGGFEQRSQKQWRNAPVQTVDMSDLPALTADEISDDSTVADDERYESGGGGSFGDDDGDNGNRRDGGRNNRRGRGGRNRRGGRDRNRGDRGDRQHNHHQSQGEQAEGQPADGMPEGAEQGGQQNNNRGDNGERRGRRRRGGRGRNRNRDGNHPHNRGGDGDQPAAAAEGGAPQPSYDSAPAQHESSGNDNAGGEDGGQRKTGWWKRLTE